MVTPTATPSAVVQRVTARIRELSLILRKRGLGLELSLLRTLHTTLDRIGSFCECLLEARHDSAAQYDVEQRERDETHDDLRGMRDQRIELLTSC